MFVCQEVHGSLHCSTACFKEEQSLVLLETSSSRSACAMVNEIQDWAIDLEELEKRGRSLLNPLGVVLSVYWWCITLQPLLQLCSNCASFRLYCLALTFSASRQSRNRCAGHGKFSRLGMSLGRWVLSFR